MIRNQKGELEPVEWEDALVAVGRAMKNVSGNSIAAVAGGLADAEVSVYSVVLSTCKNYNRYNKLSIYSVLL